MAPAATLLPTLLPLLSLSPVIAAAYVWFAVDLGPRLMSRRQPLRLKPLLGAYDVLQVALNAALLWRSVSLFADRRYDFVCPRAVASFDASAAGGDAFALEVLHVSHYQAALRLLDLADTVFLVLSKKNSNVTFLHLYHHTSMILACWLILRFDPGAATALLAAAVNNFVHSIMYTYYLLCLRDFPAARLYKRYITQLQILQFVVVTLYMLQAVLRTHCDTSLPILTINILQGIAFITLFIQYYVTTYKPKKVA